MNQKSIPTIIDPFIRQKLQTEAGTIALGAYLNKIGLELDQFPDLLIAMDDEQKEKFFDIYLKYYVQVVKKLDDSLQSEFTQ